MFSPNDLCLLFHYSLPCFHALTVVFHAHSSRMMPLSFKSISKGQVLPQTPKSKHTNRRREKCTQNLTEGCERWKFDLKEILIARYFKECWLLRHSVKRQQRFIMSLKSVFQSYECCDFTLDQSLSRECSFWLKSNLRQYLRELNHHNNHMSATNFRQENML